MAVTIQKTALVPSVTGNPAADTIIRNCIIGASGAAAGVIVTWLNAHGFNDPNLSLMISGAFAAVFSFLAATIWGWWQTHQSQLAIVNGVVKAALTGVVPEPVAAKATNEQVAAIVASPTAQVR